MKDAVNEKWIRTDSGENNCSSAEDPDNIMSTETDVKIVGLLTRRSTWLVCVALMEKFSFCISSLSEIFLQDYTLRDSLQPIRGYGTSLRMSYFEENKCLVFWLQQSPGTVTLENSRQRLVNRQEIILQFKQHGTRSNVAVRILLCCVVMSIL
jgi:hypothetical protein